MRRPEVLPPALRDEKKFGYEAVVTGCGMATGLAGSLGIGAGIGGMLFAATGATGVATTGFGTAAAVC